MNLEASIRRFDGELHGGASRHRFMRYEEDVRERHPNNRFRGAFKTGRGRAEKLLKQGGDHCIPGTLRRLTWWNLGYRFVLWPHRKGQELGDQAKAYEVFKRLLRPPEPPDGPTRIGKLLNGGRLRYLVVTKREARLATKAETKLLHDYASHLGGKDLELNWCRWGNLQCDAYEKVRNNLIEAKASCKREHIRMAVGELLDYAFLGRQEFGRPNMAILLPQKPSLRSFKWLVDLKIYFVWKEKDVFVDNANGHFI